MCVSLMLEGLDIDSKEIWQSGKEDGAEMLLTVVRDLEMDCKR